MDVRMPTNPDRLQDARIGVLEEKMAAVTALLWPAEPPADVAPRRQAPRIATIIAACARVWDVPVATIHSLRRHRRYAWPRQAAMSLSRELGHHSLTVIGRAFGRDHSTVFHAVRVVSERVHADAEFAALVQAAAALSHTLTQEAPRP